MTLIQNPFPHVKYNSSATPSNSSVSSLAAATLPRATMQEIQSPHHTPPTGLLSVPSEIRLEIYRYVLVRSEPIDLTWLRFHRRPVIVERIRPILLVSRKVSEEALDVLYGKNVLNIILYEGGPNILRQFSPTNRQRIRHLQLVLRPVGISYRSPLKLDSQIWPPTLANLTTLCIVAQQPLRPGLWYGAPSLKQEVDKWLTWLKPIMEYISQNVSSRTIVKVDDDDREETSDLVKECLPNSCQKVRTRTGDFYFMRW